MNYSNIGQKLGLLILISLDILLNNTNKLLLDLSWPFVVKVTEGKYDV